MKVSRDGKVLIFKTADGSEITRIRMKNEREAQSKLTSFAQHVLVDDYGPWSNLIHNTVCDDYLVEVNASDDYFVINPYDRRALSIPHRDGVLSYLVGVVEDHYNSDFDVAECKVYNRNSHFVNFIVSQTVRLLDE